MSLIHNERIKLLATYVNGLAIALLALGGLAPVLSIFTGSKADGSTSDALVIVVICVIVSASLHYTASLILRRLKP